MVTEATYLLTYRTHKFTIEGAHMAKVLMRPMREDLLRRIHSNRRAQTEIVESMLGQFGGTEKMQALLREQSNLEQDLETLDAQSRA